ncbi:MAG TPA: ATPase, T2SS/T4P/T4SS family [Stellaceae bacterium]|nr:ATPase, T2SS/T4P/T4SS family [Stellaceae bacterium]
MSEIRHDASSLAPQRDAFQSRLLKRLVEMTALDGPAAERALRLSASSEERVETVLAKLGLAHEHDIVAAVAAELGLAVAQPEDFPEMPVLNLASAKFLRQMRIVPLSEEADRIRLAVADPLNRQAVDALALMSGKCAEILVAAPSDIELAQQRLYGGAKGAVGDIVEQIGQAEASESGFSDDEADVGRLRDLAREAPVVRLVNLLISHAVEARASDIHIAPFGDRLSVRYRIDGMLCAAAAPPVRLRAAVVSRIKIMAKLDIAERRLPQDGRILATIRGREYDLRVATIPTHHGERVTIRILDRSSLVVDFEQLGFAPDALKRYLGLADRPQGFVLVTGPTGSGKTTTLYATLSRLNSPERNVFTVEDPVEYQLDGVNQVQVKPQIGLGFPDVLRTLLRHNPDVVMIGEMRDRETAQIAIQAALTGHLVLSTLHTNDAASAITRLLDMGVEDYLLTSTLSGVTAQRLVRRLCHCRTPCETSPAFLERSGLAALARGRPIQLFAPRGCEACQGTGYQGRVAVMEVLEMSDALRTLVLRHAEVADLRCAAASEGMRSMREDGLLKALDGITAIEEVLRVTQDL